ncbi:NADH/ubiquinone/plastoquinone (complex I) [Marinicauda algicola]|uniref:NADH/ubiquinone/plastoquinone (Complex I) n=1 Tax=Marinicauda algicola TaxID=2029849 RepID=A0A4V3RY06_9PROT|nr:proton-conducting transporter membrane subunit [Marinicauda algicola]TGY88519.1 NADH/ubiquinone/plastoquinone (complex I) [Marinicauda algicola]
MSALALVPAAIGVPLILAALGVLPRLRARAMTLSLAAPLAGLAAALLAPQGETVRLPGLLLDTRLVLTPSGAIFLGGACLLWLLAGIHARRAMAGLDATGVFALSWNLSLAGLVAVFLAGDAVTFYAGYALASFAAWPLIVHRGTPEARHAGVVYIALAVAGEMAVLSGLLVAAAKTEGGLAIADIRQAAAGAGPLVPILLIAGFAIKAGLVPVHVWKPLSYTAAPAPAAAVLSGAVAKAGLFGAALFLSPAAGGGAPVLLMTALGLFGAFYAALVGLTQVRAKSVLAYSSVSQLSLALGALGAGLAAGAEHATLATAAAVFALHHGLAKSALFLGAGAARAAGTTPSGLRIALALAALSIAGLPLSGGGLAKLAIKHEFAGLPEALVIGSAVTTALVLIRFLAVLPAGPHRGGPVPASLSVPVYLLAGGALLLPWGLVDAAGIGLGYPLQPANLIHAAWPLLAAGVIWRVFRRMRGPSIPAGDLLVAVEACLQGAVKASRGLGMSLSRGRPWQPRRAMARLRRTGARLEALEAGLARRLPAVLLAALLALAATALFSASG